MEIFKDNSATSRLSATLPVTCVVEKYRNDRSDVNQRETMLTDTRRLAILIYNFFTSYRIITSKVANVRCSPPSLTTLVQPPHVLIASGYTQGNGTSCTN